VTDRPPEPHHGPPQAADAATGDLDEAAVAAEWRKLEAERLAEEREEAREDAEDDAPPAGRQWPWRSLAAALMAGLLLALALNWPGLVSRPDAGSPPEARPEP
jgi:hypothetical protein